MQLNRAKKNKVCSSMHLTDVVTAPAVMKNPLPVQGRHWMMDLSECRCDVNLLKHKMALEDSFVSACENAGMTVVGKVFHQFQPSGVTGVVLLAESHVSVHTWPEHNFVAIDVYVCNHERDNTPRGAALAKHLASLFCAAVPAQRDVARASVVTGDSSAHP
jgi:S-adenosylmethionine decarboxylase proenzyme